MVMLSGGVENGLILQSDGSSKLCPYNLNKVDHNLLGVYQQCGGQGSRKWIVQIAAFFHKMPFVR